MMSTTTTKMSTTTKRRSGGGLKGISLTALTWIAGLLFFFPFAWIVALSLRSEADAARPQLLAAFNFDGYSKALSSEVVPFLINSVTASVVSTLIVVLLAVPAAYALSIRPVAKWRDVLFFFLSTKFLPAVGAVLPIFLIVRDLGLYDNIWALVILYTAMNVPLAIWMLRSFLLEVPREILEAAALDGAGLVTTMRKIIVPVISPGIAATALICFIFSWNEYLFAKSLTAVQAGTAPTYLVSFVSGRDQFLAQLAAVTVVVSLPVLMAGWIAQDKLVRGLSLGAVK